MGNLFKYAPRAIAAFILLQTLYFKFGIGGEEALQASKNIFGTITLAAFGSADYEGYMRIGTGVMELITSILILLNSTAYIGAILSLGLMFGAILSHLLFIGINVGDDHGTLFVMACIVLLCSLKVLYDEREKVVALLPKK